jgi:hypothetical protein
MARFAAMLGSMSTQCARDAAASHRCDIVNHRDHPTFASRRPVRAPAAAAKSTLHRPPGTPDTGVNARRIEFGIFERIDPKSTCIAHCDPPYCK